MTARKDSLLRQMLASSSYKRENKQAVCNRDTCWIAFPHVLSPCLAHDTVSTEGRGWRPPLIGEFVQLGMSGRAIHPSCPAIAIGYKDSRGRNHSRHNHQQLVADRDFQGSRLGRIRGS
jgi:hypothetical protein